MDASLGRASTRTGAPAGALSLVLLAPMYEIVIPVLGILFLGYMIYKNITGQVFPYSRFPLVVGVWLVVGALIVLATPRLAARIGEGLGARRGPRAARDRAADQRAADQRALTRA